MKKGKKQDILNGPVTENLLFLMTPILICGLFQQLYQMADAIVVGQFAEGNAIAVVGGSASMLISLFTGLAGGIVTGSMFVTAYFYGSGNDNKIRSSAMMSLLIAAVIGIACTVLFILFGSDALALLQVPEDIFAQSVQYMQIYSLGFAPYFLFQICVNQQRAMGEAKRPSRYLILSFLLNIVLDYLFTGLLHLQQNGVAVAFIFSQSISAAFVLHDLFRNLHIQLNHIVLDTDTIRKILSIGIPSSITSIIYACTNVLIQSSFNLLGSRMVAGYAIHCKIESLFWIVSTGLGTAVTTFAGQNYGAGNFKRIKETVRKGIQLGCWITLPISAVFYFGCVPLCSLFTSDPELISIGSSILRFMAPFYLLYPAIEVLTQVLKCIGKAVPCTVITLLSVSAVRVLWILSVAMKNLTYENILLAFPISWIAASSIFLIYYVFVKKDALNEKANCLHPVR